MVVCRTRVLHARGRVFIRSTSQYTSEYERCILSTMARNATRHSEPRVLASSRSAVVVPTPKFLSLAEAGILAHRRRRRDRSSFIAQRCKNRAPHPNELLPRRTWFWLNHPRGLIDQSCQRIADFGRLGFFPLSRSSSMRTKSCAKDTWQIAERRARDDLRATMRAREARARACSLADRRTSYSRL